MSAVGCAFFFFFQAEDGIRDLTVTGVQTCALPICAEWFWLETWRGRPPAIVRGDPTYGLVIRTLSELRRKWDELEDEQRGFLADVDEADLFRPLDGKTPEGRIFSRPLGMLLLHVPTHA